MQGGGFDSPQVAATVKHFAGYSESINGHDRVEAQLPIRYLQDIFLPSYAGGIDAGAATVMVDSGSINNIPATASHFLLTTELRQRLGFEGVVISDYGDVPALQNTYHVAADFPGAIAKAVNAGVDVSMTPFDYVGWNNGLIQDVQNGLVYESAIDASVRRILTLKFKLGLFDHPYVDPSVADAAVQSGRDVTLRAARESITLLRNQNNVLPLSPSREDRRYRAERRLDDQPARRLERELAGRLRRRARLLHGAGRPDPARDHGARGPSRCGSERDVRARPGRGRRGCRVGGRSRS